MHFKTLPSYTKPPIYQCSQYWLAAISYPLQTGSGKTFTITGGAERFVDRGIIPRTLSYIFQHFQQVRSYGGLFHWQFFLPEASFGLQILSLPASVCPYVCVCVNHELVCMITHCPLKLGSPNLDQRCKTPWLRSLLFWGGDWLWPARSNLTYNPNFVMSGLSSRVNTQPLK